MVRIDGEWDAIARHPDRCPDSGVGPGERLRGLRIDVEDSLDMNTGAFEFALAPQAAGGGKRSLNPGCGRPTVVPDSLIGRRGPGEIAGFLETGRDAEAGAVPEERVVEGRLQEGLVGLPGAIEIGRLEVRIGENVRRLAPDLVLRPANPDVLECRRTGIEPPEGELVAGFGQIALRLAGGTIALAGAWFTWAAL